MRSSLGKGGTIPVRPDLFICDVSVLVHWQATYAWCLSVSSSPSAAR